MSDNWPRCRIQFPGARSSCGSSESKTRVPPSRTAARCPGASGSCNTWSMTRATCLQPLGFSQLDKPVKHWKDEELSLKAATCLLHFWHKSKDVLIFAAGLFDFDRSGIWALALNLLLWMILLFLPLSARLMAEDLEKLKAFLKALWGSWLGEETQYGFLVDISLGCWGWKLPVGDLLGWVRSLKETGTLHLRSSKLWLILLLPWTTCLKVLMRRGEFLTSLAEFAYFVGVLFNSLSLLLLLLWNVSLNLMYW